MCIDIRLWEKEVSNMPAGRPLKFGTVKELQRKIENYFKSISKTRPLIDNGVEVVNDLGEVFNEVVYYKQPSVTGMANYLDTSRETLMNYEKKDKFFDTIKKAKQLIEQCYEERLIKRGSGGDIFAMKNFGWVDKQEVVNTNMNTEVPAIIDDSRN